MMQLDELRKLPVAEKLRIVEELWDDIGAADELVTVPGWALDEERRRWSELQANPQIALSRDELWQRVDEDHG
jgi:putative addiction module component (TIGR02574 family)